VKDINRDYLQLIGVINNFLKGEKMKLIIKSILVLIMLSGITQAQQWKLKISLEKKTYVEEANIYLLISLKNISGTTFERNTRVFEFLLKNLDEDNQSAKYKIN